MAELNPYNFCTLDENADCVSCDLDAHLSCRWNKNTLGLFMGIGISPFMITLFGFVVLGLMKLSWWWLIGYVLYFIVFFGILEARFLCSHCPFYARGGKTLKCLGNNGNYKFWKYHPEPINGFEKFLMIFVIVLMTFLFIPLIGLGYGIYYIAAHYSMFGLIPLMLMIGLCFAAFVSGIGFIIALKKGFCSRCINFSCGLNTVPKEYVDAYLRKNNVMREAWEKAGYVLD